jgi:hypothetical protein
MNRKEEALRRTLDASLRMSLLSASNDGRKDIHRSEFVLGMLEGVGLITRADYEPFLRQFASYGMTGDGRLSVEDVRRAIEKEASEKSVKESVHVRRRPQPTLPHGLAVLLGHCAESSRVVQFCDGSRSAKVAPPRLL